MQVPAKPTEFPASSPLELVLQIQDSASLVSESSSEPVSPLSDNDDEMSLLLLMDYTMIEVWIDRNEIQWITKTENYLHSHRFNYEQLAEYYELWIRVCFEKDRVEWFKMILRQLEFTTEFNEWMRIHRESLEKACEYLAVEICKYLMRERNPNVSLNCFEQLLKNEEMGKENKAVEIFGVFSEKLRNSRDLFKWHELLPLARKGDRAHLKCAQMIEKEILNVEGMFKNHLLIIEESIEKNAMDASEFKAEISYWYSYSRGYQEDKVVDEAIGICIKFGKMDWIKDLLSRLGILQSSRISKLLQSAMIEKKYEMFTAIIEKLNPNPDFQLFEIALKSSDSESQYFIEMLLEHYSKWKLNQNFSPSSVFLRTQWTELANLALARDNRWFLHRVQDLKLFPLLDWARHSNLLKAVEDTHMQYEVDDDDWEN
jgi:hypothetical protein